CNSSHPGRVPYGRMLPLRDENPTRRPAVMTLLLIGVCAFVYFGIQQSHSSNVYDPQASQVNELKFTLEHAAIPKELTHGRALTRGEVAQEFSPAAAAEL